jgi:hypothetical protein
LLKNVPKDQGKASRLTVKLEDGRELMKQMHSYPGMPEEPLSSADVRLKFDILTAALPAERADRMFTQLLALEEVKDLREMAF